MESTSSASSESGSSSSGTSSTTGADEVKSLLATITAIAGPPLALTAKDRKRAVRLRKGGEKVIPTITALSDQFGLSVPSHPTSEITVNAAKAQSLVAIHKQMVKATKQVSDAIFSAQSKSWEGATVHYSVLRRLAKTDGDLETGLAPVTEFFAKKSPAVVQAEDAKRGGKKGSKAAKAAAAAKEAEATQTAAPSPTPVTAPITPPHA